MSTATHEPHVPSLTDAPEELHFEVLESRDARRARLSSGVLIVVVGAASTWLPWFLNDTRPIFSFYASAILPFTVIGLSLLIGRAIELGYRRVEWKCDSHNAPSRRAAERLGFRFEGVFRQHMVIKGRNRDTAWFGLTDGDWALLRPAHQRWLSADNFDAQGRQRTALSALTRAALAG